MDIIGLSIILSWYWRYKSNENKKGRTMERATEKEFSILSIKICIF